jgi:hypothetical protein
MNKSNRLEIVTFTFGIIAIIVCLWMVELALDLATLTDRPDKATVISVVVAICLTLVLVALSFGRLRIVTRDGVQQISFGLQQSWNKTHKLLYHAIPYGITFTAIVISYFSIYVVLVLLNSMLSVVLTRSSPRSQWTVLLEYFDAALPVCLAGVAILHVILSTVKLARFLRSLDKQSFPAKTYDRNANGF